MTFQLTPLGVLVEYETHEELMAAVEQYRKDIETLDEQNKTDNDPRTEPLPRCKEGEIAWYAEYSEALAEGHIYSQDGLKEFSITRLCEYHFDQLQEPTA